MATPFEDLLRQPGQVAKVVRAFSNIIACSYADDRKLGVRVTVTDTETRRRFKILETWFRVMRGEKQWTLDRIIAALPAALRAELNGGHYEPDSRTLWVPNDGSAL